jgi:hypothetical protein
VDLSNAPAILADLQIGVLARSALIAAVIVAPYGWYKRRQVRALRAASEAPSDPDQPGPTEPTRPRLEDLFDSLPDAAATARTAGSVTVLVPRDVTVDGADAPPAVVDALVRDGLRRSGLVAVAEVDGPTGRSIECRPAPTPG